MSFKYLCLTNISSMKREIYFEKNEFFFDYNNKNFLSNCSCSIVGKIIDKVNMIGYIKHIIIEHNSQNFSVIKDFPTKIFVKINILPNKIKLKSKNNYASSVEFLNETSEYDCVTKVLEENDFICENANEEDNRENEYEDDGSFTPYDKETVDNLLKIIVDNREFLSC